MKVLRSHKRVQIVYHFWWRRQQVQWPELWCEGGWSVYFYNHLTSADAVLRWKQE